MSRLAPLRISGAVLLLLLGGGAFLLPAPMVDNSALVWVEADDPAALTYKRFQQDFGADEVFAVRLAADSPKKLLPYIVRFHTVFDGSPIIDRVLSASSSIERWSELEALLATNPAKAAAMANTPLNNTLGLFDLRRSTALVVGLSRLGPSAKTEMFETQLIAARKRAEADGLTVRMAGNPLINLALDRAGAEVEHESMPILIAICVALLLVLTRSFLVTAATLLPAGFIVKGADACIALSGKTLNIVANISKPLLFVLLLAGALHIVVGWQDAIARGVSRVDAPFQSVAEKGKGVFLALLTSAIGFGSLAFSTVPPIRLFGLIAAGGLMVGVLYLLVLLPFLLRWVPLPRRRKTRLADLAVRLTVLGRRQKGRLPVLAAGIVCVGLALAAFLTSDPHAIRYFSEDTRLRIDHEALERAGVGLASAEVLVEAPASLMTTDGMAQIAAFSGLLREAPGVKTVIDPALLVQEAAYHAGIDASSLSEDRTIATLHRAFHEALADFVSTDGRHIRLSLLIGTLDSRNLSALRQFVRSAFEKVFAHRAAEAPPRLTITGNYEILLATQAGLLGTLKQSLLVTALLMTGLFLVFLRSVRLTAAALLPNLFPVSLNFIIMYLFDMPLDVGASMTAAIALGIAVDDTLHFVLTWRHADIEQTARTTGRAIILTSVIITAGFVSLLGSDFVPTRHFGLLCGIAMLSALTADLMVLPALLDWIRPSEPKTGAP